MRRFELFLTVQPGDIDGLGHVNNVVYLGWMQQAATAHWEKAAPPEIRTQVIWVATRHEIDYKLPGFVGEALVVRTWTGEPSGATWERFTEVRRTSDDRLLAKSRSVYAALDPATGRPRRVEGTIRAPLED